MAKTYEIELPDEVDSFITADNGLGYDSVEDYIDKIMIQPLTDDYEAHLRGIEESKAEAKARRDAQDARQAIKRRRSVANR